MSAILTTLQSRFSHPDVTFSQRDKLVLIEIVNAHGALRLTTHGAILLSYRPQGGKEVLWVSETAVYDGSKPVRGGVPVCWPWFGAHPTEPAQGAHGFVRHQLWEVEAVESIEGGATRVRLGLEPNAAINPVWPHPFMVSLVVTLGETLQLELTGRNLSREAWSVTEAFHAYFQVAQAEGVVIRGLEGGHYFDKNRDFAEFTQGEVLRLEPPMDCVYTDHLGTTVIEDSGNWRQIEIQKRNSASTIIWNPGPEGVKAFADIPDDQYACMVCVESGNALKNGYELPPGGEHTLAMTIRVKPMQ